VSDVLARRDTALSPEQITALLRDRVGDGVLDHLVEYRTFTVRVHPDAWVEAARMCRDEPALDFDLFDCLFGVDARDDGFDVIAVLYSTSTGMRVALRTRCDGGREAPSCPSITDVYRGANWMERETWDMFGIDFPGHPGLAPRLLTVENFEGWPLRKDFRLASRVVKPWPGVKEPAELDEDGNVIEREPEIGGAPGPYDLDKAIAAQAREVNAGSTEELGDDVGDHEQDEEAGDDADADREQGEEAGDDADAPSDASADTDADAATAASARAEERRREQVEARRRKAAERASEADADADADDEDADSGGQDADVRPDGQGADDAGERPREEDDA
jgi:NADH:ubiquinone oxidoreductase subunit C